MKASRSFLMSCEVEISRCGCALLEMTEERDFSTSLEMTPSPRLVISTEAERNGEISKRNEDYMQYYVYILTNKNNTVLYIGVTNNLERRMYEHKNKLVDGFTKRYNISKLVFFESSSDVKSAIGREKQLKKWSRRKKEELINQMNPSWKDLSENWSI